MFEEVPFIIGFMLFSYIISYILFKYASPPFTKIIQGFAIVGIVFHELCHLFMSYITHTRVRKVSLIRKMPKQDSENDRIHKYYGEVSIGDTRISFLQALLVGFAPLYISFWVFFFLLDQLCNTQVIPLVFVLYIFIMVSISLSAAPSFADLRLIPTAFQNDISHSLYQIMLIILSISATWLVLFSYKIHTIHELLTYLIITACYFTFKYGFIGIGIIKHQIKLRHKPYGSKIKYRKFYRRRYKPQKPHKIGIEEAPW